jgi:tetraacyldisaccharide-1-P 4'-kinase
LTALSFQKNEEQLLVTGIANADTLKIISEKIPKVLYILILDDHHLFEQHELENIKKIIQNLRNG